MQRREHSRFVAHELPIRLTQARFALAASLSERRLRIALVKQDCNEDLYCCPSNASTLETLASTLLRSGPVALFTTFDTRFFIVRTEPDQECNIWREKSDPLAWAPCSWFEAYRDRIPGRDYGQSRFALGVDDIDWQAFDLVISVDISVPARITRQYPQVVWAYYVREIKAPSWRLSFEQPLAGQDLFLSQRFSLVPSSVPEHVVDFPYHFQYCGIFHEVFGGMPLVEADKRSGVFVDYHSARFATEDELRQLEGFGPVQARRAKDDRFDLVTGERIPDRSMAPEGLAALMSSKYYVKWGGRTTFGTGKVEAIAAGCLALSDLSMDGAPYLHSDKTSFSGFSALLARLRFLENHDAIYRSELERQRQLVDYLCYLRPANDLLNSWQRVQKDKTQS